MCPVCIATAALIAGKATSTAGLAAVAVSKTWHRLQPVKHVASGVAERARSLTRYKQPQKIPRRARKQALFLAFRRKHTLNLKPQRNNP